MHISNSKAQNLFCLKTDRDLVFVVHGWISRVQHGDGHRGVCKHAQRVLGVGHRFCDLSEWM